MLCTYIFNKFNKKTRITRVIHLRISICFSLKRTSSYESFVKESDCIGHTKNWLIRVICYGDLLSCMFFYSLKRTDWIICSGLILSAWFNSGNQSCILIQCAVWINGSMHVWELLTEHNSATIYFNGWECGHHIFTLTCDCQIVLIALQKYCCLICRHQPLLTVKVDLFPVSKTPQACTSINNN